MIRTAWSDARVIRNSRWLRPQVMEVAAGLLPGGVAMLVGGTETPQEQVQTHTTRARALTLSHTNTHTIARAHALKRARSRIPLTL